MDIFVKPDDQSQTCLRFGMARKSRKKGNCFSHVTMLCILAFVTTLSALASSPPNDVWQSHAQDVNQAMENFIEAADEYDMEASLSNQTLTIHLRKMERLFSPRM